MKTFGLMTVSFIAGGYAMMAWIRKIFNQTMENN
jgi:hypothetical protein